MMAGRIDDEKLYKRSLNHEPTKSVSTLNIFQLDFTFFFDLKAIVLSPSLENFDPCIQYVLKNVIYVTSVVSYDYFVKTIFLPSEIT